MVLSAQEDGLSAISEGWIDDLGLHKGGGMSRLESKIFKAQVKKVYKEQAKGIPKSKRLSFHQFYLKYKEAMKAQEYQTPKEEPEDFDFSGMVNVNDISELDVGSPVVESVVDETEKKDG